MTFIKILFAGLFLLLVAGFGFLAITDVNIPQKEVTKTVPLSNINS